jgi:DNA mismatch endonuclease (patch repair protein)
MTERVYRPRSPEQISRMMSAVRGTQNRAEILLRKALWARGFRYRLYVRGLPGRPDMVFAGARTVVFVDGDFWHGRLLLNEGSAAFLASFRTPHRAFWIAKISRNVARDRAVSDELKALGWHVIRVWEKDVLRRPNVIAALVARMLMVRIRSKS